MDDTRAITWFIWQSGLRPSKTVRIKCPGESNPEMLLVTNGYDNKRVIRRKTKNSVLALSAR